MKTLIISLTLAFAFLLSPKVNANDATLWNIDNYHSNIAFTIHHYFTPIPGTFHDFSGVIRFDPENLAGSEIDVVVQVASVDTNVGNRDNHLRTDDFFDAATYPEMRFRSTDIRSTGDNNYVAVGMLTIKDVTREVELPFQLTGVTADLRNPDVTRAGLVGNIKLNRLDFGVGVGNFASTAVIGNEVNINLFLQVYN
jgi:polyisoprenoid-binding protein YceI